MRRPLRSGLARRGPIVFSWAVLMAASPGQSLPRIDFRALADESAQQYARLASGSLSSPPRTTPDFDRYYSATDPQQRPSESLSSTSWDLMISPKESTPNDRFIWVSATYQSLLYTGTMHAFNLLTEAGTRDTMTGPWMRNYLQSVSELRGWSDGDRFMSPYVGHTIEGGIFGYIFRQNSPKYRNVQWGDGREYYMGLMKSLAYSAVWHTQWKIGNLPRRRQLHWCRRLRGRTHQRTMAGARRAERMPDHAPGGLKPERRLSLLWRRSQVGTARRT